MSRLDFRAAAVAASEPASDEFTFGDFAALLLRRWWALLAGALIGLWLGASILSGATVQYTSELKVSPVQAEAGGLMRRLGGLASLAGVGGLGKADAATPFDLYLEAYFAPEVAERLAEDPALLRGAFWKEWRDGRWTEPRSAIGDAVLGLKRALGAPVTPWREPDAGRFGEWLIENVAVNRSNRSAIVTVSLEHPDPAFARDLLARLHREADRTVRAKTLDRTAGTVAYLERKLGEVLLAEHREALAQALGEQERSRMMASVQGVAFAAEQFGAPRSTSEPTSPRAVVTLGAGLIAGLLLGVLAAIGWHVAAAWRRDRGRRAEVEPGDVR
jgi:hypothetical protein